MASKAGRNKKRCEKYKMSGHQQINKQKRQEKAEKRKQKFAAKREAGKAYEYKPNPYKKGSDEYNEESVKRAEKALASRRDEFDYNRLRSIFAKLDNSLQKQKAEEKKKFESGKSRKKEQSDEYVTA